MTKRTNSETRERWVAALLWGGVGIIGQYTALFLTIVQRIRVEFENQAPVITVTPSGPIALSWGAALAAVWVGTFAFGMLVVAAYLAERRPSRAQWVGGAVVALTLAVCAALAEPSWGLVVLIDALVLAWVLRRKSALGVSERPAEK